MSGEAQAADGAYHRMIAVDIGNTAWKFGLFDAQRHAGACDVYPYSMDDWFDEEPGFENLTRKLGVILRGDQDERLLWAVASVNAQRTKWLRDYLALNRPRDVFREISVGDILGFNPYRRPEALGVDRFLAATAAARRLPGRRILIADIGTATKIDYVDMDGRYRGGAIFPGPAMAAHALFERTDRLPDVGNRVGGKWFLGEPQYPAVDTGSAIEAGIYGSLIGALLYFYGRLKKEYGELSVILTGRGSIGLEPDIERLLRYYGETESSGRLVWTTRDLVLTGVFLTVAPQVEC